MDFCFTSEQEQLREMLQGFLAERNAFEAVRQASRSETGWRNDLWLALAEDLGITGAALPESVGGLGGGPVDIMIIMEELGAAHVIEPYLETVVIGGSLLLDAGDREADLSAIVNGKARYAFVWAEPTGRYGYDKVETRAERDGDGWILNGTKSVATAAPWATGLFVTARTSGQGRDPDGISLFLVDPASNGVEMTAYPTIDGRRAADIHFRSAAVPANALLGDEGQAFAIVEKAGDVAIAAQASEAVGVMRRLLHDTIEYTGQRRQFGQPISNFQVLQHRMVDMSIQLELARSAVYLATLSLDAEPMERAKAASAAKVAVGNALRFIAQNAVQLHGGMGITDELPVGHYFKRATVMESEFGSVDYHLDRFARITQSA